MILDDGSHINEHVIFSFQQLWGNVKSGGVYIVEDVGTAYWDEYGGGLRKEGTSIEYFKKLKRDFYEQTPASRIAIDYTQLLFIFNYLYETLKIYKDFFGNIK